MGIGERIKIVRKSQRLTQEGMAQLLNLSKPTVAGYEYEKFSPSDRTLKDMCRLFNVNEDWLLTGEGEMYRALDREDEIAKIAAQIFKEDDSDFRWKLQKLVSELNEEQIVLLHDMVMKLAEE